MCINDIDFQYYDETHFKCDKNEKIGNKNGRLL